MTPAAIILLTFIFIIAGLAGVFLFMLKAAAQPAEHYDDYDRGAS